MTIENVTSELRTLRRRIDAQQANQHTWPTKDEELAADLDRYDRRLLKAASMLRVETPAGRISDQFLLSENDRAQLEHRLVGTGLDVRAAVEEDRQA